MKSGFTLVELSIVLVIIGLLIGGILVGQSLVSAASISSQVSQLQHFDAAVAVFKDKFRNLPGDSPAHSSTANGDGIISCGTGCSNIYHAAVWRGGAQDFWANLMPNKFTSGASSFINSGAVPEAKIGKSGSLIMAVAKSSSVSNFRADTSDIKNYYAIFGPDQGQLLVATLYFATTSASTAAVKPVDALSLDQKMDDGLANAGYVRSGSVGDYYTPDLGPVNETAASGCSSGASYTVATDSEQCTPIIRIGSQIGDLQ